MGTYVWIHTANGHMHLLMLSDEEVNAGSRWVCVVCKGWGGGHRTEGLCPP